MMLKKHPCYGLLNEVPQRVGRFAEARLVLSVASSRAFFLPASVLPCMAMCQAQLNSGAGQGACRAYSHSPCLPRAWHPAPMGNIGLKKKVAEGPLWRDELLALLFIFGGVVGQRSLSHWPIKMVITIPQPGVQNRIHIMV